MLAVARHSGCFLPPIVCRAPSSRARVIIVNGSETEMDHLADEIVTGDINTVLPQLCGVVR